jgi:hypothetical protein
LLLLLPDDPKLLLEDVRELLTSMSVVVVRRSDERDHAHENRAVTPGILC